MQPPRAGPAAAVRPPSVIHPGTAKVTGESLVAPITALVSVLKFLKNDAISANSAQKRTLIDTARRLDLVADNPFKDIAELLMMDASLGSSATANAGQLLGKSCDKTVAILLRILPKCTPEMPQMQARLVAVFVRRIVDILYPRDEAELALFK